MKRAAGTGGSVCESRVVVFYGDDRDELIARLIEWRDYLRAPDDALALDDVVNQAGSGLANGHVRVAMVADSLEELLVRVNRALERLQDDRCVEIRDIAGIYYAEDPAGRTGKIALLFPGEASQYYGMLRGVETRFSSVAEVRDRCRVAASTLGRTSNLVLPFLFGDDGDERETLDHSLLDYSDALYAVLIANWALHDALIELGVRPDVMAGHSAGEFSVLTLSGVIESQDELYHLVRSLDAIAASDRETPAAGLLAVGTGAANVQAILDDFAASGAVDGHSLFVAMDNCPHQSIVVGQSDAVSQFESVLRDKRLICEKLPLMRPYHTPLFASYMQPMCDALASVPFAPPRIPIYSATTASLFPADLNEIRALTVAHWERPVLFTQMIEQLYDDGVRIFIEAGPRGNLHSFVQDILRRKPVLSVATNVLNRSPLVQLDHCLAQLVAHHVPLNPGIPQRIREAHGRPALGMPGANQVLQFQQVMDQFLDVQAEVMEKYLGRRRVAQVNGGHSTVTRQPSESVRSAAAAAAHNGTHSPRPAHEPHPLLGATIEFQSGRHAISRRRLDLAEDLYAPDHAVGGQDVSEVDRKQCGLPVVPMTFTLETMGAIAGRLFPDKKVVRIEDVRLHRWLAYYDHDPATVEVEATWVEQDQRDVGAPAGRRRVRVEIRDLGNAETAAEGAKPAAMGEVLLDDNYPAAPEPKIPIDRLRPSRLTLKRLYQNLFHGQRFHGVLSLDGFGDKQSRGHVESRERNDLFRSVKNPGFHHDPVMLDVAMHIMAGWHLEHEDQTGRLTLPFKLDAIEFFRPGPRVGESFEVRTETVRETSRQYGHDLEIVDSQGAVYARYHGIRLWRFYLPVGEVNFHGPKNIYYLSEMCNECVCPTARGADADPCAASCVLLEPPKDLVQPALMWAASRVILSQNELAEYVELKLSDAEIVQWLFSRAAIKDAVRKLWERCYDRRLFAADVEVVASAGGWSVQPRAGFLSEPFPRVACARHDGAMVAVAAFGARPGVAMSRVDEGGTDDELLAAALHDASQRQPLPQQQAEPLCCIRRLNSARIATCLIPDRR